MKTKLVALTPLGSRASRALQDPGPPSRVNEIQHLYPCQGELAALEQNALDPHLSQAEHARICDALDELLELVWVGRISFDGSYPMARTIDSAPFFELRPLPEPVSALRKAPRLARLYMAEPLASDKLILGLHLATKPNGPDTEHEQREAIREGCRRADLWMEGQL